MAGALPIKESSIISRPKQVIEKEASWYNRNTGVFNIDEIPKEVKNIIKQIGIRKKDLLNPERARPIYDIIQKFGLGTDADKGQQGADREEHDHHHD